MIHIVTGTPGTGKTTFAKKYAKENSFIYVDGKKLIKDYSLVLSFDNDTKSDVIDEFEFAKVCKKEILIANKNKVNLIIDSHLSQFIDKKLINTCFVTHCSLKELECRLKKRRYSKKKIRDNLDAEIFRECELEAEENGHSIKIILT